jgi:predicted Zn-ribbon and HTH transcriptional regulator
MPIGFVPPSGQNTTVKIDSGASKSDIESLQNRFEKLKLVTMAMWTFLKDEKNITEDALIERVREIDKLDGSADGKLRLGTKKCGKCGRTLNPKFEKCLYCGFVTPIGSVFETF